MKRTTLLLLAALLLMSKRRSVICAAVAVGALVALALNQPLYADTKVVDPSGGGDYTTIQAAVNGLTNSGPRTIIVRAGIYHEAVPTAFDLRELLGIPIVTTFHLFQHQVMQVEKLVPTEQVMFSVVMEGNGLCASDRVIVCSKSMEDYIGAGFGMEHRPVKRIPNAIEPHEFDVEPVDFKCDKPVVLFSGRLSKQKGIEQLVDAIELTDRYFFVVMGRIPAIEGGENHPYAVKLRELEAKHPDRLRWLGHIEGPDRFRWFKRADVGIVPSLCEPFGIVALEFFAAQTPLVTTAVDGLSEFVNEENAFIIPNASPENIIAGLQSG